MLQLQTTQELAVWRSSAAAATEVSDFCPLCEIIYTTRAVRCTEMKRRNLAPSGRIYNGVTQQQRAQQQVALLPDGNDEAGVLPFRLITALLQDLQTIHIQGQQTQGEACSKVSVILSPRSTTNGTRTEARAAAGALGDVIRPYV